MTTESLSCYDYVLEINMQQTLGPIQVSQLPFSLLETALETRKKYALVQKWLYCVPVHKDLLTCLLMLEMPLTGDKLYIVRNKSVKMKC